MPPTEPALRVADAGGTLFANNETDFRASVVFRVLMKLFPAILAFAAALCLPLVAADKPSPKSKIIPSFTFESGSDLSRLVELLRKEVDQSIVLAPEVAQLAAPVLVLKNVNAADVLRTVERLMPQIEVTETGTLPESSVITIRAAGFNSAPPEKRVTRVAALTQRMAVGEEAAFREFHAAYATRLFRYVLVLLRGDEHAAADVLQDTLIRAARHARRFEEERVLWDWLARLARSAAADHGRKGARYLRLLDRFFRQRPEPEPPDEMLLAAALDAALERIPADDAALLRTKYHGAQSQRELAAAHGITEDALESRLRRARAALRTRAFQILRQHEP
jgi:RNA polymerase sigma-70 factor (ECF subfamily)